MKSITDLHTKLCQLEARAIEQEDLIREAKEDLIKIADKLRRHKTSKKKLNKLLKGCRC